jgi:flagellar biosynthesis protein FlhF
MLVKKYEAKDMQQAMDDVVKELGSTAVILNSRKIRKKGLVSLFSKPLVEVMVAYEPRKPRESPRKAPPALREAARGAYGSYASGVAPEGAPAAAPSPAAAPVALTAAAPLAAPAAYERAAYTEVALPGGGDIGSRLASLDQVLNDFIGKFSHIKRDITWDFPAEVENLLRNMCENQVREELALSIAREAEEILKKRREAEAYEVIYHLVLDSLGAPAPIAVKKYQQKVILFVGPTGVGKTTSLVKLASAFAINHKQKAAIINTDTYRIAAHEQLRTYADILDIPLAVAYRMEEVETALADMGDRDVIFIDTAGKRPGDPRHQEDISRIISYAKPEDIFLCVAAPTCFSAVREIVDTYAFAGDYKLLFTKLDETRSRGMVLNTVRYAKRPLAYITTGQNVPDDLEIADCPALARQILER